MLSRPAKLISRFIKSSRVIPKSFLSSTKHAFKFTFSTEKMQFKAETKRLLDIVAKSLYTDSEVFIRQLLSNASDALQKQRFKDQSKLDLRIKVELFPTKNQLIIEDNGIGMSKQSLIDHLGTIAKSGSKQFVQNLQGGSEVKQNIIGQFGVGFYSAFIVADLVEVISKQEGGVASKWTSDGSGTFQIGEAQADQTLQRGTRIILHLKQAQKKFLQKTQVQQIIQKYSNFINYPIQINGQNVNLVKPIWCKTKTQVTDQEYNRFFQYLTNASETYKYKIHFQSDVPLNLKSLLYIPSSHSQKFGLSQEKGEVSLYSKRVLIKKNCKEILLPNFLRFIKGVVDCQDIPLNISRQTFQDTALIHKLKSFLTKKILKTLKDQAQKRPQQYTKWYEQFSIFIKQGSLDADFKKDVIDLNRYQITTLQGFKSLKDYVANKKNTQDAIFFVFASSKKVALDNPYVYPLAKENVPVLVAPTHIEQIVFNQIGTFQGLKFVNVQTGSQDVQRVLKGVKQQSTEQNKDKDQKKQQKMKIPQEQLTAFSLWIKNELQPFVQKVVVSKKSMKGPALVISPISSSMRQMAFMRQMMQQNMKEGLGRVQMKNLTFQFDQENQIIVKLNEHRKVNAENASMIIRQLFDNACIQVGLEGDYKRMVERINTMIKKLIDVEQK